MIHYDKDQLRELCDAFDLVEYVESTDELKRNGDEYSMHCPCHKDDNPSMYLNKTQNNFYCHSCRRSGGPLQWFMQVEGLSFPQAVEKLQQLTGKEIRKTETASSFSFFKNVQSIASKKPKQIGREILPADYYEQFAVVEHEPHEWIEEGISEEMIRRFDIRIDTKTNRIVYPVYDNHDNLIGVKGRTRFENYKVLGIKKYSNYTKVGSTNYFQGMHENRANIQSQKSAIVVEGIKSVMKISGWGFDNSIAAETACINDEQIKILLEMNLNEVTIAFDKDVDWKQVVAEAKKFSRFMNTFVVYDKRNLLDEKESPCDKGEDIWRQLYSERIKII